VDVALFYSGLVAFTALMVFGALAVMAVVPMIIPGYTSASITSGSMMPTLRVGDVVIAVDHDGTKIAPGTVVVYEEPRRHDLVTHRVVSTNADGSYITKGDANGGNDPAPIPAANIRGKTQWIVPFVGLPRVWAAQHQWTLLILTIAFTAMTVWMARFAFDPTHDPWPKTARSNVEVPS
jgi:signal peptidase